MGGVIFVGLICVPLLALWYAVVIMAFFFFSFFSRDKPTRQIGFCPPAGARPPSVVTGRLRETKTSAAARRPSRGDRG